jgi:hypothetical protein
MNKTIGLFLTTVITSLSLSASAATLNCCGLWAGVESIMNVTAVVNTAADGAPAPFNITVNNAEFRGSMMPAGGGLFSFNVRRVGAPEMFLNGNVRFLTTVTEPAKTGFALHTSDGRIEAILTCDAAR